MPILPITRERRQALNNTKKQSVQINSNKTIKGEFNDNRPTASFGGNSGQILSTAYEGGVIISHIQSECTCGGINERCIKCDGTGYCAKKIIESGHINHESPRTIKTSKQEVSFSNDPRGGVYGIRENGRFFSNPSHDDHE